MIRIDGDIYVRTAELYKFLGEGLIGMREIDYSTGQRNIEYFPDIQTCIIYEGTSSSTNILADVTDGMTKKTWQEIYT